MQVKGFATVASANSYLGEGDIGFFATFKEEQLTTAQQCGRKHKGPLRFKP